MYTKTKMIQWCIDNRYSRCITDNEYNRRFDKCDLDSDISVMVAWNKTPFSDEFKTVAAR